MVGLTNQYNTLTNKKSLGLPTGDHVGLTACHPRRFEPTRLLSPVLTGLRILSAPLNLAGQSISFNPIG